MIDLAMIRRKDGLTVLEAMENEPFGFAVGFRPSDDGRTRTVVFRWPFFVTAALSWLVLAVLARVL